MKRPNFFQLTNGSNANLPFTDKEYENRLKGLRKIMSETVTGVSPDSLLAFGEK